MKRWRWLSNALVVLVSTVVGLLVAEWIVPHVVELRDVGASYTAHDPVVGKRLKPHFDVVRVSPEFTWRFTSNSLGTRGEEPPKPLRGPVVFLGDSFTMGYGVNNGEEYPARLGAEFRLRWGEKAPYALNLGIGNTGNGFWLRHLDHSVPTYAPRLVVLQVLQNDFLDNLNEGLYELAPDGGLVELPVPPPSWRRQVQHFIERSSWVADSNLFALARQVVATHTGAGFAGRPQVVGAAPAAVFDEKVLLAGDRLTLAIVEAAVRRCTERGWPVLVLSVGLTEARREAIAATVRKAGAALLELPSKKDRPDLFFAIDGHWNAKGQAEAAQRVLAVIDEKKLLALD